MKRTAFLAFFLLLAVSSVVLAVNEDVPTISEGRNFKLTTLLYGGAGWVSLEVEVTRDERGEREVLYATLLRSSHFGLAGDSFLLNGVELPPGSVEVKEGGKVVALNIDVASIPGILLYHRTDGGALVEEDVLSLGDTTISFSWRLGEIVGNSGGKIQAFYQRPDGEWVRLTKEEVKRRVEGRGEVFGFTTERAETVRAEYFERASDLKRSSVGIGIPEVTFPKDTNTPEEP